MNNPTDSQEDETQSAAPKSTEYIAKLGGRKFSLVVLVFIGTAVLCWFGKINEGIYSVVTVTLIGAYITGNVLQKKLN